MLRVLNNNSNDNNNITTTTTTTTTTTKTKQQPKQHLLPKPTGICCKSYKNDT
jgi:hypothetical protein